MLPSPNGCRQNGARFEFRDRSRVYAVHYDYRWPIFGGRWRVCGRMGLIADECLERIAPCLAMCRVAAHPATHHRILVGIGNAITRRDICVARWWAARLTDGDMTQSEKMSYLMNMRALHDRIAGAVPSLGN